MDPLLAGLLSSAPPRVSSIQAEELLQTHWGIDGSAQEIACERDQNFRIFSASSAGYVLKLSNPVESPENTDFQTAALRWLERVDPALPFPRAVAALNGCHSIPLTLPDGRTSMARVLSWLDGAPLHHFGITQSMQSEIGSVLARLGHALAKFDHPGAHHDLLWDIRNLPRLHPLMEVLDDDEIGEMVRSELARFGPETAPQLSHLRRQVVHNDMNHHNILVDPETPDRISGVLDFGDMVNTHLVIDVAVAASYLASEAEPLDAVTRMVAAYHAVTPLQKEEIVLLRDLIVARLVASITITTWRAARYPENADYILRNNGPAKAAMLCFASLPTEDVTRALLRACNME
ncbi:phosphotransferase [Roseovarius sp.]|uniref:phosphotransferase n=1 Tax=Roseovarius sp. TaxID=1486281 RepID=UPI003563D2DE